MINQVLPTISYGDAVSNSAVNMMKVLNELGIESHIYAQNIHPKMSKFARPFQECPSKKPIIYHLSTGSELAYHISKFPSKKYLLYHNVTPSDFFAGYNGQLLQLCQEGREQAQFLSNFIDFAFADSEYNRQELIRFGYKQTAVTPIIMNFEDYSKKPCSKLLKQLQGNKDTINLLFVGRIAPNKKQDDIIKIFYYYKKFINTNSRLFLVGSYQGMERYYQELLNLVKRLGLEDVYITGHIPFDQILAYYNTADLFLCMSEHEGFCVPIVEAMHFEIPIISYESSALGETLGNGGFLTRDKDYKALAELVEIVLKDTELKRKILDNQKKRLDYFSTQNTKAIFKEQIGSIISST